MNHEDSVRLARIEERQIHHQQLLEAFIEKQEEYNKSFWSTRYQVLAMAAKQEGAWKTVGIFGALTVAVSSAMAWVVTFLFGRG